MSSDGIGVLVIGADGRMGSEVVCAVEAAEGMSVVGTVEIGDDLVASIQSSGARVAVDFTTPDVVEKNLRTLVSHGIHPVIGTTGLPDEVMSELIGESRDKSLGGLIAPNFALGAVLMMQLAAQAARYLPSVEITEYHHPAKLDAPSGTSLLSARLIQDQLPEGQEVPIHSVRLGGYLASQEIFLGGDQERLTIRHDSLHRSCFMPGVVLAIRRVVDETEIVVGLENFLEL